MIIFPSSNNLINHAPVCQETCPRMVGVFGMVVSSYHIKYDND